MKLAHTNFSDSFNLFQFILRISYAFTGLACTKFSDTTKNTKITKFSVPINLVTLRIILLLNVIITITK